MAREGTLVLLAMLVLLAVLAVSGGLWWAYQVFAMLPMLQNTVQHAAFDVMKVVLN